MARNLDILFSSGYIKNVLYFAVAREGKDLKDTEDTHFFCIDNDLVYENYYSDFGPLNLGCVYKYCRILNAKLNTYSQIKVVVHYTSMNPKKKANAAYLLGCFGVLYLNWTPREALEPLKTANQIYRPFQDATQGNSEYTISLLDCLNAIKKAHDLGFFDFNDFNYEEYNKLDKIHGGDLNWIVPHKFCAFIGPVDYKVSFYHPPDLYIDYFLKNDVKIVIRLNKKNYDQNVFTGAGILHYDLFFHDGTCPSRHILHRFLQIAEESNCAIAVHCKAGLGRTGTLIGCYLIKHYRMTAREAIGWMRICRPGSVIGQQQGWLEHHEAWLMKQGIIYRKHMYQDANKLPKHEYGIYSIAEKMQVQRPVIFRRLLSPSPPTQRLSRHDHSPNSGPQASKTKEDETEEYEEEYIGTCDLTIHSLNPMANVKGCVLKKELISEADATNITSIEPRETSCWKTYLCCRPYACVAFNDACWLLAVCCAKFTPNKCSGSILCSLIDRVAYQKPPEREPISWRVKSPKINGNQKSSKGDASEISNAGNRRSGAGDPRINSRTSTLKPQLKKTCPKSHVCDTGRNSPDQIPTDPGHYSKKQNQYNDYNHVPGGFNTAPLPPYRSSQSSIIKNVTDARNYLMRSSCMYNQEKDQNFLNSVIKVIPQQPSRTSYVSSRESPIYLSPTSFTTASRGPTQPQNRRRLGRSPSPPMMRSNEQNRATNTSPKEILAREASKCALREALSRLKLPLPRDRSSGAASLGAREAPMQPRTSSVRSDERPIATQGDLLNSIKFQRRLRETIETGKLNNLFYEKVRLLPKERSSNKISQPKAEDTSMKRERFGNSSKTYINTPRPSSPKGRRNMQYFY